MHLRFEDLGRAGTELNADVESTCSSFGRIVRIVGVVMEKRQRPGKLQIKRVAFQAHELERPQCLLYPKVIFILYLFPNLAHFHAAYQVRVLCLLL